MEASRLFESLFLLSNESLKDVQTSIMQSSADKEQAKPFEMIDVTNKKSGIKRRKADEYQTEKN